MNAGDIFDHVFTTQNNIIFFFSFVTLSFYSSSCKGVEESVITTIMNSRGRYLTEYIQDIIIKY